MPRLPAWALAVLAVAALVAYLVVHGTGDGASGPERLPEAPAPPIPTAPSAEAPRPPREQAPRSPREQAPREQAPRGRAPDQRPASALDLEGIGDADEREAITAVVRAIDRGGPFAYRRDGVVFENREHRLAAQARGWWHEYTVPTPGEDDRGARRIVAGRDGELFYSRDHYRTFRRIRGPTR